MEPAPLVAQQPQRAAPPSFTDADAEPFFVDARDALVGPRPGVSDAPAMPASTDVAKSESFRWSELIDADSLETEVKRLAARLESELANAATFKSGGSKTCRADFALLSVLFAVIEQYDGDVRWKSDAAAERQAFAEASTTLRDPSDKTYSLALQRRDELTDLIRGGRAPGQGDPFDKWSALAERPLLMQRMQRAVQEGVNPHVANEAVFRKAAVDVQHEAQVLRLLAEIIHRADYENWDDETFGGYAAELGVAAGELSRASAEGNYEAARAAAGRVGQSCVTCHDGYRL